MTGIPAYQLTNQHLDASVIFSAKTREILERLQQARDHAELIAIIEAYAFQLLGQMRQDRWVLSGVSRQMMRTGGMGKLDSWADQACLSTKQFKRKFYESTGVNPKTYARIIRFNQAFNRKNRFPQADWLSIALQCGYCDYQHLAKDYKDFTGLTPIDFHQLEAQSPEKQLGLTDLLYQQRVDLRS
ncbi:helix-turn-helix domain-containing protein [Spirosoma aerolatum]|uniref:helix-turn-helix domain-containing protein n=1 Tax=Spirosoma aerolatum TaxID=1211326 RepID=UPI0009ABBCDF|nr:helix-turn-helix domain-containing protein [Spirosoma aerolatum]